MRATRPRLRTSTGCDACRYRKKKCDETHPTCSACIKRRLHCTWKGGSATKQQQSWQIDFEVVVPTTHEYATFDDTHAFPEHRNSKFRTICSKSHETSSSFQYCRPIYNGDPPAKSISALHSHQHSPGLGPIRLHPDVTTVARQQFVNGYSFLTGNTTSIDALYSLVEPLYRSATTGQGASARGLTNALDAIALAYMGSQSRRTDILLVAQRKYVLAIGAIRALLVGEPDEADVQRLLMATRLCMGYEFFVSDEPRKAGWAFHLQGQAILCRALLPGLGRGHPLDRALFFAAFLSLAVAHGYARAPLPISREEVARHLDVKHDLEGRLVLLTLQVNGVRRAADRIAIQPFSAEAAVEAEGLILGARELAEELERWLVDARARNGFRRVRVRESGGRDRIGGEGQRLDGEEGPDDQVWADHVHDYRSPHEANLDSLQRCWIIYVHAAIIQVQVWRLVHEAPVSEGPGALADLGLPGISENVAAIKAAVDDICAAVPFYLGLHGRDVVADLDEDVRRRAKSWGGGHSSLWPWLGTAVGVECIPVGQRRWLLNRLGFIGNRLGHRWAGFIYRNPPSDVILGSKISPRTQAMYRSVPGWPRATSPMADSQ